MFGKIKRIDNNEVTLENVTHQAMSNLINCHVVFEDEARKLVGEVLYIDEDVVKILLVGEIEGERFNAGTIRKPSGSAKVRVITISELELIYGKNEFNKDNLYIGKSAIYKNFKISVPLNDFFGNHSAIIGNSGAGKSCGVARMLQNLFLVNPEKPIHSHVVLFDAYGEYANTFDELNRVGLKFTKYSTNVTSETENLLTFPAYYLDVDDLAILLQASSGDQIPVLSKTLKLVSIFMSDDPKMIGYKNDIIAACLMDVLTSGRPSTSIRDQIIAVLTKYNTKDVNLDSIIHQPGYDRTIRQCLQIDNQGKMSAVSEVVNFLEQFESINLEAIEVVKDYPYTLEDLYYALEFALISEGTLNNDEAYKQVNILKTRLQSIINSDNKNIFDVSEFIPKDRFIMDMFGSSNMVDINLSYLDDRMAKIMTKLYSKLMFIYTTEVKPRASISFNIILEEAHRYVQNDTDTDIIGYNIFDRITKEGRKYGTLLTFITQRPSELSNTALSQCSNYVVFRIFHPKDLDIVRSMSTNVAEETIEQIKSLNSGTSFVFGTGFKLPTMVMYDLPNPLPESTSVDVTKVWYND